MTRPDLRLLLAATAALVIAAPAGAQMKMNMPGMTMPMPVKKPVAKKTVTKKVVTKKPGATTAGAKRAVAKAPAKRPSTPAKTDPMAGMDMPAGGDAYAMPGMDMPAGQDMSQMAAPSGTDLPAGNAPPPAIPSDHAADAIYGAPAMAMGRHHLKEGHGGQKLSQIMFNLAEAQFRNGRDGFEWNGEGWYGGDINRFVVKSEGDGAVGGRLERAAAAGSGANILPQVPVSAFVVNPTNSNTLFAGR